MNPQVEALGSKLMKDYQTVGFDKGCDDQKADQSIPKQVQQFYVETPTQYRLLYLQAFLYTRSFESKVIVFVSNCESVNFLHQLFTLFDWNQCGRRTYKDGEDDQEDTSAHMYEGKIFKLHGDMDHASRKMCYFGFDKEKHSLLVCTDVASRGLDFKGVDWIINYDLTSKIKEYINRVGRTARIAAGGNALNFLMPQEAGYVPFFQKTHNITLLEKNRYILVKQFEATFHAKNPNMKHKFRKLVNIVDRDEQQESLHAIRQYLTTIMPEMKVSAQIARSSSTRAYAGHSPDMRHIFDMKELNLTELARSFGLYK